MVKCTGARATLTFTHSGHPWEDSDDPGHVWMVQEEENSRSLNIRVLWLRSLGQALGSAEKRWGVRGDASGDWETGADEESHEIWGDCKCWEEECRPGFRWEPSHVSPSKPSAGRLLLHAEILRSFCHHWGSNSSTRCFKISKIILMIPKSLLNILKTQFLKVGWCVCDWADVHVWDQVWSLCN